MSSTVHHGGTIVPRRRLAAAALAVLAGLAIGSTSTAAAVEHATLSKAEQAFIKAYKPLVPNLNKASSAVIKAVGHASKDTDAQIVTIFTGLANQWTAATKPLLALKAPPPEFVIFAAIKHFAPLVAVDLRASAQAGRTHSFSAAKTAGNNLARDFNALGGAVGQLKKKLGLP